MRPQIVRNSWDFDVDELANFYVEPTDATENDFKLNCITECVIVIASAVHSPTCCC